MRAPNDNNAAKDPRGWWPTPARHCTLRLINPWASCHIRALGVRIEVLP